MLVGVNVGDSWLSEVAMVMNCKTGRLSFVYLGLPIDGDAYRLNFWVPLLNCIKARTSCWKSKSLSFGGRVILLKSIMSYFLGGEGMLGG